MAQSPAQSKAERLYANKLRYAVDAIERDENLRFFLYSIFQAAGLDSPQPVGNALELARVAGRGDTGYVVKDLLDSISPTLYQRIMLEAATTNQYAEEQINADQPDE